MILGSEVTGLVGVLMGRLKSAFEISTIQPLLQSNLGQALISNFCKP